MTNRFVFLASPAVFPIASNNTLEEKRSLAAQYGSYAWDTVNTAITSVLGTAASAHPYGHGQREAALVAVAGTGAVTRKMPERPLTIATYAAGASLAAITLVYVFGPTFFLDDEAAHSSRSSRKKGVVGLVNPANDCFINSVLQALAGLPELRAYLIREMHQRKLDGESLYRDLTAALEEQRIQAQKDKSKKKDPEWKLLGLQQGTITAGLKDVLDALNERPIYRKTISAQAFVRVVENSFRTRISRSQQDAQEFLQVVAERLADEHRAAKRVRRHARGGSQSHRSGVENDPLKMLEVNDEVPTAAQKRDAEIDDSQETSDNSRHTSGSKDDDVPDESPPFPFEGRLESQVECSYCHFKPKPAVSSFVSLTLHVPQNSASSTLNECFDGMLKVEHIDDFTCDRCRLEHALQVNAKTLTKTDLSPEERMQLEQDKTKLETALQKDPEKPPKDVKLPHSSEAPKRQISRHMRISKFPRILAIHLSRSVWDAQSSSTKNMAKVSFPETLPLGGLLDRKTYRLRAVVTHKGGHDSGHYESFRRQTLVPPFSTPASMGTEGIYSLRMTPQASPTASETPSPHLGAQLSREATTETQPSSPDSQMFSTSSLDSPTDSSLSSYSVPAPTLDRRRPPPPTSVPLDAIPTPGLPPLPMQQNHTPKPAAPDDSKRPSSGLSTSLSLRGKRRGKVPTDRWWRISDEKVKESKTAEMLAMQREVYLLFYEMTDE